MRLETVCVGIFLAPLLSEPWSAKLLFQEIGASAMAVLDVLLRHFFAASASISPF